MNTRVLCVLTLLLLTGGLLVSCDDDPATPTPIGLSFSRTEIFTWADSSAYVASAGGGRVESVGFYTGCVYELEAELVELPPDTLQIEIAAHVHPIICIRNVHSRYRAVLEPVPPGAYRLRIRERSIRTENGQIESERIPLDTLVTLD